MYENLTCRNDYQIVSTNEQPSLEVRISIINLRNNWDLRNKLNYRIKRLNSTSLDYSQTKIDLGIVETEICEIQKHLISLILAGLVGYKQVRLGLGNYPTMFLDRSIEIQELIHADQEAESLQRTTETEEDLDFEERSIFNMYRDPDSTNDINVFKIFAIWCATVPPSVILLIKIIDVIFS